jgi:signal transduction histidine kinase/ActR/RegA family two-component response regulator
MKNNPNHRSVNSPRSANFLFLLANSIGALRLSTKAILLSIALTTFIITTVFITLSIEIRNETKQLLQDVLNRSERQVLSIKEDNLSQLLWVSNQIANNPTLRAAMETYRLESNLSAETRQALLATVQNELDKIWTGLPHDILFVTNETGQVVAANGDVDLQPEIGQVISAKPTLKHALDPQAEIGDRNFGVIQLQDQHYFIGTSPIYLRGYVLGTLTLGDRIDGSFLPNIRAFFGGDTVVTAGGRSISSTLQLPEQEVSAVGALGWLESDDRSGDGIARLGGEDFLITSMLLGQDDRGDPVTLFLLRSLTQALRQPNQKLMKTLATQALLAVLLGALLTWVATRASLRPLVEFVDFMKGVAESGDYSRRFRERMSPERKKTLTDDDHLKVPTVDIQSTNELDLLVNGFNGMLSVIEARDSSLRKAHDELEASIVVLRQKEEQLRQMQKMEAIGLLAGGVAHDFNNILMVISGFSEIALHSLEGDHAARASIEEVQKASKSASLLTRQLLAFSRKQVTRPRVINLNNLIIERENILRRVVGDSVEFVTRLAPELGNVLADPAQLEQVLLNLIVNGRDAIEGSGTIILETANIEPGSTSAEKFDLALEQRHIEIAVSDSGCGMGEEEQERIFEPFFTTKEKGKGTGLGLSTVHGIVMQSGGQIRVDSKRGTGTVFRIFLPCIREDADESAETTETFSASGSGTILVVEDEPDVRKVVCEMLRMRGYDVLEAPGPFEALDLFEEHRDRIDLLLTDVIMPGMSGRDLYEKIILLKPTLRTLYISGYTDGQIEDTGFLPEGVDYLQKPFSPDALATKVAHILDEQAPRV